MHFRTPSETNTPPTMSRIKMTAGGAFAAGDLPMSNVAILFFQSRTESTHIRRLFKRFCSPITWTSSCTTFHICGILRRRPSYGHPSGRLRTIWHNGRSTWHSNRPSERQAGRLAHRFVNKRHNLWHSPDSASGWPGVPSYHRLPDSRNGLNSGRTHAGSPSKLSHTLASWHGTSILPLVRDG